MVVGAPAEGDLGGDGAREIFVGDGVEPLVDLAAQRFARVDLMTRDPDVHLALRCGFGRGIRPRPRHGVNRAGSQAIPDRIGDPGQEGGVAGELLLGRARAAAAGAP